MGKVMKDVPVKVMKGVVNMDSGERTRVVELPRMEALAITSTVQLLMDHDRQTGRLQQEISEAQRRLQRRLGQRQIMKKELEEAFQEIRLREAIPSRIDPMQVKWHPGGRFEFQLLEGEPDGPDAGEEGGTEEAEPEAASAE
jgi:hypothetical protein